MCVCILNSATNQTKATKFGTELDIDPSSCHCSFGINIKGQSHVVITCDPWSIRLADLDLCWVHFQFLGFSLADSRVNSYKAILFIYYRNAYRARYWLTNFVCLSVHHASATSL